jgi:hypothetical protein
MKDHVNVEEWVVMFEEVGLDEAKREQWHKLFESRHPAGHQEFLLSLGIPAGEVTRIRSWSRGEIEDDDLPEGEQGGHTAPTEPQARM